jgi:hypothetical protein
MVRQDWQAVGKGSFMEEVHEESTRRLRAAPQLSEL